MNSIALVEMHQSLEPVVDGVSQGDDVGAKGLAL